MAGWVFCLLSVMIILASFGVALLRNVMHSALLLGVALTGVAGLFLLLGADFLAAVQIIVYVSGVLILMLFVVMLTHRLYDRTLAQTNERKLLAAALCLAIFAVLCMSILRDDVTVLQGEEKQSFREWVLVEPQTTVATIGEVLLKTYVIPFEVASVLLLAAMIGAILFTKREPGQD